MIHIHGMPDSSVHGGPEPDPNKPGHWRVRFGDGFLRGERGKIKSVKSREAALKLYRTAIVRSNHGRPKRSGPDAHPEEFGIGYMQGRGAS